MTDFAKTQAVYQFILPNQPVSDEATMTQAIIDHYQAHGFAILTLEDVFNDIAFYEYEAMTSPNQVRTRLYRQVVGYGIVATSRLNNTPVDEQETQIVAFYQQQGVAVTTYTALLMYFPWHARTPQSVKKAVQKPTTHKLF